MKSGKKQEQTDYGPFSAVLAAFKKYKVEYIIIGGQAVIVYGASQFTRDADFWVNPTKNNIDLLKKALRELKTTPRFLPPLQLSYLKKGHGVHFRFKYKGYDFLIDILGKPPRVSGFSAALKDAEYIDWHKLKIPVIDIPRLVATKKTDRDKDYLVIKLLAESVFEEAQKNNSLKKRALSWLSAESRNASHLKAIARSWKGGKEALLKSNRPAAIFAVENRTITKINQELVLEKEKLKKENIEYWRPLLHELRQLRRRQKK